MGQVIIRNLDDGVIERLRMQAIAQGKSLERFLRELVTEAAKPSRAELLAQLERIRSMTPSGGNHSTAEELIREDRDSR